MALEAIASELLRTTAASRITIRLARPDATFPIEAEALTAGVRSLREETIDPRSGDTFRALEQGEWLVQADVSAIEPAPPPELIERYQVRAQMLAPIVEGGSLLGVISVHECRAPREWASEEIDALRRAVDAVKEIISTDNEERGNE